MDNPTLANMVDAIDEISEPTARRLIAAAFETMSDEELADAYEATDGQPGDPIVDLLAVALEERGIDL
jgi:hypothetical protein